MPLTLYYLEASPPVRSVDLVIHALGLKAEHKKIDLFAQEHMSPEYLKVSKSYRYIMNVKLYTPKLYPARECSHATLLQFNALFYKVT